MAIQETKNIQEVCFWADCQDCGKRLDVYLAQKIETMTRSAIQKSISGGQVLVNGRVASKNTRMSANDKVTMGNSGIRGGGEHGNAPEPQEIDLDVLYEDDYFVAVNKPAGLVVHPGNGNQDKTLVNALLFRMGALSSGSARERPGIVHRLDKDTSGVIIAAKTDQAHSRLAELFSARKITKIYTAFCIGLLPPSGGVIDFALARSRKNPVKRCVNASGKHAVTEYQLLRYHRGVSVIKLNILTGRTHQIRVHCSYSGFPVIGDDLYGADRDGVLKIPPMERPFAHSVLKCFSRQALHALSIGFIHPFSNQPLTIRAPFAGDFLRALELMQVDPAL